MKNRRHYWVAERTDFNKSDEGEVAYFYFFTRTEAEAFIEKCGWAGDYLCGSNISWVRYKVEAKNADSSITFHL